MQSDKTLILGLGNDILSDDRIGPELVNDLSEILDNPGIKFETASSGGLELMETIKDFKKVIEDHKNASILGFNKMLDTVMDFKIV